MPAGIAKARPAVLGAWIAAIGASVCCVVPLVLALLGISGAWIAHLTALEPWRPWLITATLACLALAHLAVYRPRPRCGAAADCLDRHVLRRRRIWLSIATAAIALLLLFPYYIAWFL
jgi:mercuric ion transport protein